MPRARRVATTLARCAFPVVALASLLALVAGAVAADDTTTTSTSAITTTTTIPAKARTISVHAKSFEFDPTRIEITKDEKVRIALTSEDVGHNFVVQIAKGKTEHVADAKGGKTGKGGLRIRKKGTYIFYCSIAGHRAAGMEGKIVVRPRTPASTTTTSSPPASTATTGT